MCETKRVNGYKFKARDLPIEPKKKLSEKANRLGERYGRLVVREFLGVEKNGFRWWGCECDCGELIAVRSRELNRGHTKSCGCLQKEVLAKSSGKNKLPYGYASRNELLTTYKKSAIERNIDWALKDEYFFELVQSDCSYCGCKPNRERKAKKA